MVTAAVVVAILTAHKDPGGKKKRPVAMIPDERPSNLRQVTECWRHGYGAADVPFIWFA